MATRVFSDEELERLRSFPGISREELIRFFTLTPADVAFIDPGRGRWPADRLGLAVQLCMLPRLGFVPDDIAAGRRRRSPGWQNASRFPLGRLAVTASANRLPPSTCGRPPATWAGGRPRGWS